MERDKALDMALGQIEKQFGKGSIMRMGENLNMNIEAIPTGALALDLALGIGGLPRGRIVEIFGSESSGKTTLTLHCIAEAQRRGGAVREGCITYTALDASASQDCSQVASCRWTISPFSVSGFPMCPWRWGPARRPGGSRSRGPRRVARLSCLTICEGHRR